jgi:hypothetical protein
MARVKASGFSQGVTRKAYKQMWEDTHVRGAPHFDKVAKVRMPGSSSTGTRQRNDYGKVAAVGPTTAMYDEPQITNLDYPGKGGKRGTF